MGEASVMGLAVLVGVALAAEFFLTAATAFVLYQYVWKPWKVMRTDMAALNQKVDEAVSLIQTQRVIALSDEEVAFRERQMKARQTARHPVAP